MNIVLIIALVILIAGALTGLARGLVKSVFATFSLIVAVVLAFQMMPYGTKLLKETPVYTSINSSVSDVIEEKIQVSMDGVSGQMAAIEAMELPDFLKNLLKTNNNSQMYDALGVARFTDYISGYITCLVLNGISLLVSFLVIYIILRIVGCCLDMLSKVPVVNGLNRFGGLCFGLLNGAAFLWLACIVVTIFSAASWGQYIFEQINDSVILSFIYNNNYLLVLLANMGKVLY